MLKLLVAIYVCYHIPAQLNIHSEHVLLGAKHRNSKGELKTSGQFLVLWCRRKQLVVPLKSSLPRRKNKTKQKTRNRLLSLWLDWYKQSVQDFSRGRISRLVLLGNMAQSGELKIVEEAEPILGLRQKQLPESSALPVILLFSLHLSVQYFSVRN